MRILLLIPTAIAAALLGPQTSAAAPKDPTQAQTPVPPLAYTSALARYKRLSDPPPPNWRAANDEVERIGGWRAYLREAQRPDDAASAPPPKVPQ